MKKRNLIMCIAAVALVFTACKKEGDTIINNFTDPEVGFTAPKRTMLKAYGLIDSSQTIRFTYQNNEIGKIKELVSYDSGSPTTKYVILYNGANKPEGYQTYTLPANTLNGQGTMKLDNKGRIVEVIKREVNGDTIGIGYFQYIDLDYQPVSFSFYNHADKRYSRYEYYVYDTRGNITRVSSYADNGTDPLYKSAEIVASGYGKAINPLNQLYNYIVTLSGDYGLGSSAALYLSNFLPSSTREQNYKIDGSKASVYISNLNVTTDSENRAVTLNTGGLNPQNVFFKY